MASLLGVQTYVAKCYRRQQAAKARIEILVRQMSLRLGGTLLEGKMEEQRIFNIIEEVKRLMNESEDLGSMRRLLGSLKVSSRTIDLEDSRR